MNDVLIITYDSKPGDEPVLIIGRQHGEDRIQIINRICGEKANEIYMELLRG